EFGELLGDKIAGPLLNEAQFGMGVDIAADLGQFVHVVAHFGNGRHGRLRKLRAALPARSSERASVACTISVPPRKGHGALRGRESGIEKAGEGGSSPAFSEGGLSGPLSASLMRKFRP